MATSAPSRAKAMATARPMPESPPVISAPEPGQLACAAVGDLTMVGLRLHQVCESGGLLLLRWEAALLISADHGLSGTGNLAVAHRLPFVQLEVARYPAGNTPRVRNETEREDQVA